MARSAGRACAIALDISPAAAGDTTTEQRIERSGCSEPTGSTLPVGSESPSACTRQRPPLTFSDVDRASSKCMRPASSLELVQAVKRLQVEPVLSAIHSSISKTAMHRPWRRAGSAPTPASRASRQARRCDGFAQCSNAATAAWNWVRAVREWGSPRSRRTAPASRAAPTKPQLACKR